MPLNSYLWIHKDAKLTMDEKNKLMNWADAIRDSMKAKYPIDSLVTEKINLKLLLIIYFIRLF